MFHYFQTSTLTWVKQLSGNSRERERERARDESSQKNYLFRGFSIDSLVPLYLLHYACQAHHGIWKWCPNSQMFNNVQIKLSSISECFLNLSSRSLQFTAPFFLTANSHDAPHVLSPRHSAGSFTGTRATWEAWKQTKYNKIHFKFIFQTGNNLIIYLQLGGYSGSCKRTAMQKLVYSNRSFHIIHTFEGWLSWVSLHWSMWSTGDLVPPRLEHRYRYTKTRPGNCAQHRSDHASWRHVSVTECEVANFEPHKTPSRGHDRPSNMWWICDSPHEISWMIWMICLQVMDIQRRFKKKTPTISLRCHSGSQHCATMMSLLQLDSHPRTK